MIPGWVYTGESETEKSIEILDTSDEEAGWTVVKFVTQLLEPACLYFSVVSQISPTELHLLDKKNTAMSSLDLYKRRIVNEEKIGATTLFERSFVWKGNFYATFEHGVIAWKRGEKEWRDLCFVTRELTSLFPELTV